MAISEQVIVAVATDNAIQTCSTYAHTGRDTVSVLFRIFHTVTNSMMGVHIRDGAYYVHDLIKYLKVLCVSIVFDLIATSIRHFSPNYMC